MSLNDNQAHRDRWLQNVKHILAEIEDLRSDILIALQSVESGEYAVIQALAEADVYCDIAQHELDHAAANITGLS